MEKIVKTLMIASIAFIAISTSSCQKGETGPSGKDGNANVISSNEITTKSSDWSYNSANGGYYVLGINSPLITQNILDKGVVLCYNKLTSSSWVALPYNNYTFFILNGGAGIIYDYNANPGIQTYRLVVISASELAAHPKLDLKNFNEVAETFDIQK